MAAREGDAYGMLAEFDDTERLLDAARKAREAGYRALDAFTPFPVHGLADVLEFKDRKVQATVLTGGVVGALTGFGMQTYATVIHYPLNVGGRPYFSWPAYIIITFELTVLFAALSGVIGMLVYNRLPRPHHPVFAVPAFERASNDRFFLLIKASDPKYRDDEVRRFLAGFNPLGVSHVER